jgi:SNF2 family DNA or RNA helicase
LGKTLIAAEFARHALDVLPKSRCGLIVSPPLVIDQTIREFSRFCWLNKRSRRFGL